MNKILISVSVIGAGILVYKVSIYLNAYYKLKKERRKKIVNLETYSEYKKKLKKLR